MPITPTVEERAGCGPAARLAARLPRRFLRPLVAWLPWTPFTLRFAPLIELGAVLLVPPRGTKVGKVNGLGAPPNGSAAPASPAAPARRSCTSTGAGSSPAACAPIGG
ncbi:hypothetical protein Acsp03_54150 [Actinomadura sp. NBRC 104412]|uniref:hypothetical protein n=1 Tax=Actinomadura sp. NBRC 104412 TaxID=3032203 RepID=UPI0024A170B5|nr:hypothetical protein [Actinomadura sp. NBRC 104412]GLZ07949.1 hypothetical protein Acsp03_54150 [Actinomadura sp. NBRC 104412]